jgi:hypothetical protein
MIPLAHAKFTEQDMKATEPAMKIGLLATVNPQGLPHLTLISSLKAATPETVTWGQFTEGMSKQNLLENPKTAFLIMTLDKQVWRGKARWTHSEKGGPEYEWYNNIPMFRYNAYFGIHTVHFMDLVGHTGRHPLPMNGIVFAALKTMLARLVMKKESRKVMNPWTLAFFNKIDNLKFLAWVDEDGFPWVVPAIQAQAGDGRHLLLSTGVFGEELKAIPTGAPVAVLGMALTMEDVLARGTFQGIQRYAGLSCARVLVDWVYNPMPPVPGQIYPPTEIVPVTSFR